MPRKSKRAINLCANNTLDLGYIDGKKGRDMIWCIDGKTRKLPRKVTKKYAYIQVVPKEQKNGSYKVSLVGHSGKKRHKIIASVITKPAYFHGEQKWQSQYQH
jgi:hypothetical protein